MADLLGRILPVFAVIAIGTVAGCFERFGERTATVLNDLVYWIALPALPLLALGAVAWLGVPAPWAAVLVVMCALPDAATVFGLTAQYRTWYRESTAVVVITTALSLLTLPLVLLVLP